MLKAKPAAGWAFELANSLLCAVELRADSAQLTLSSKPGEAEGRTEGNVSLAECFGKGGLFAQRIIVLPHPGFSGTIGTIVPEGLDFICWSEGR